MTITQALNDIYPFTKDDRTCRIKFAKKQWQRDRLQKMLTDYRKGANVDFSILKLPDEKLKNLQLRITQV